MGGRLDHALQHEYGAHADKDELVALCRVFGSLAHQYFCWVALGATENEARRSSRAMEPLVNEGRGILDKFEAKLIGASVGRAMRPFSTDG